MGGFCNLPIKARQTAIFRLSNCQQRWKTPIGHNFRQARPFKWKLCHILTCSTKIGISPNSTIADENITYLFEAL